MIDPLPQQVFDLNKSATNQLSLPSKNKLFIQKDQRLSNKNDRLVSIDLVLRK